MSRQDKATTDKFARTLRELVKRPENKACADCKRNDPRWASWNIGVFLCIRCSGVHRGMGTHISKVKSVDLDVWTPEQMESIQKWGNYLANLYWEAHLKSGHIPPEHKIESFIRSKYESRRWALDGPVPTDPSVLDNGTAPVSQPAPEQNQQTSQLPRSTHTPTNSISGRPSVTTRQPQAHQLLSVNYTNAHGQHGQKSINTQSPPLPAAPAPAPTPAAQQPKAPENDLFSLDFHAPPASSSPANNDTVSQPKNVKQDILSLFSSPPVAAAPQFNQFGGNWANAQPQQQPTSMVGSNGAGAWGTSSGWTGAPSVAAVPPQSNVWGNPTAPAPGYQHQQSNLFNTNDVWNTSAPTAAPTQDLFSAPFSGGTNMQKKDDVFGDLWGGFK